MPAAHAAVQWSCRRANQLPSAQRHLTASEKIWANIKRELPAIVLGEPTFVETTNPKHVPGRQIVGMTR